MSINATAKRIHQLVIAARSKFAAWYSAQSANTPGAPVWLWNPLATAAWSLLLTPVFGAALVHLNWVRMRRPRRARIAGLWFWASLAWVAFYTITSPSLHPPLWAYLVFLSAWIGLSAYPQHLSVQTHLAAQKYSKAPWSWPIGTGTVCLTLVLLLGIPFHSVYKKFGGPLQASTKPVAPVPAPVDISNRVFSAEEITQLYSDRVLEIGVSWKVPHGMWFWKSDDPTGSDGSGIMLANSAEVGLIVTNFHVVYPGNSVSEGSYQCGARQDSSQSYTEADFIARAKPPLDLALLVVQLNPSSWKPAAVPIQALDNLHQGESVVAIGNALGEGLGTTNGIVSHLDDSQGRRYIRTSAPISPGNSGGPLITQRGGFYVGITTASSAQPNAQNFNMAIPAEYVLDPTNWDFVTSQAEDVAKPLLESARQHEHH